MKIFLKRVSQYVLFWIFLILLLEIAGYTINRILINNKELPTPVLFFAVIGAVAFGFLLFLLYRRLSRSLK